MKIYRFHHRADISASLSTLHWEMTDTKGNRTSVYHMNINTYGSKVTKGKHINFKIQVREIWETTNLSWLYDTNPHSL